MNKSKVIDVFGVILIILGIIFVVSPKGVFESIVLVAGIIIIAYSLLSLLISFTTKNTYSTYLVFSAVIGLIFGVILVSNTDSAVNFISVLLGIWLFVSGLSTSLAMHKMGTSLSAMTSPITRMVLGLVCFATPVVPLTFVGVFVGVILILSGINTITNAKNEEVVYKVRVKK